VAIGLRTSVDTAEAIKLQYGTALPETVNPREEVDLHEFDDNETERIPSKQVAEIVAARVEELFSMVQKRLKAIDRDGKLPAGIVLTGGGAKLSGLVERAKQSFRMAAALGLPQHIETPIEKIADPSFATAVGLVLWAKQGHATSSDRMTGLRDQLSNVSGITQKVGKWIKSLMP
jgi:cell division protein FtsA